MLGKRAVKIKKLKHKKLIVIIVLLVSLITAFFYYSPAILGNDLLREMSYLVENKTYATDKNGYNLMLVNYENHIPKNYKPKLKSVGNGQTVDERIYPYLTQMINDAKNDGVYMVVVAGYRTNQKQRQLMKDKIWEYIHLGYSFKNSKEMAEKLVAIADTSEHQLGLSVDINQDSSKCSADKVYDWLYLNAHKYGFVKRYSSDKINITKITNEPWHYRYVGKEAAEQMKSKNLCLEEYVASLE